MQKHGLGRQKYLSVTLLFQLSHKKVYLAILFEYYNYQMITCIYKCYSDVSRITYSVNM